MDGASTRRPIFHLDPVKRTVRVRNEVERRVLGSREKHVEPLAHQVGVCFGDTEVALVFGVMSNH
ncbi:hypothetical protein MYFR107205_20830 [Mycolicibacterium frederiksbergense]